MIRVEMGTSLVLFAVAILLCGVHAQTPDDDLSSQFSGHGSAFADPFKGGDETLVDQEQDLEVEEQNVVKYVPEDDFNICQQYPLGEVYTMKLYLNRMIRMCSSIALHCYDAIASSVVIKWVWFPIIYHRYNTFAFIPYRVNGLCCGIYRLY